MQVRSLGQEDPLEEGLATHSSILAGRIPWTEEPGGLQSIGSHRVRYNWSHLACMHAIILECSLSTKVTPRVWQNGGLVWDMLRYQSRWLPLMGHWQEGSQMATTNCKGRWLRRKRIRCGIRQQSSPVQSGQTRIETQVCLPPEPIFLFAALFSVSDVSYPSAPIGRPASCPCWLPSLSPAACLLWSVACSQMPFPRVQRAGSPVVWV